MSEKDADYFADFFGVIIKAMQGEVGYEEIGKKYSIEEILENVRHGIATSFLTMSNVDSYVEYLINLINFIHFLRSGKTLDLKPFIKMYNEMSMMVVEAMYNEVREYMATGLPEDDENAFRQMLIQIEGILADRNGDYEDITGQ